MTEPATTTRRQRNLSPAGILFALLGLALFVYFVSRSGVHEISEGIQRLGAGFVLILAISGMRPVVRCLAWLCCFEDRKDLRLRDALGAYLAGDAVGTLMPLGLVVTEPVKVILVRQRVPVISSLSALAIENLFYALSVSIFLLSGLTSLLLLFPLPGPLRIGSYAGIGVIATLVPFGFLVIRREWRFLSGFAGILARRGVWKRALQDKRAAVARFEDRVYGFYRIHRRRALPILLLEMCFHLAAVLEIYILLRFIHDGPPSLLAAFVLESANRLINVVFKFVPLRVGVDEAGTGLLTDILKFGTSSGVTIAIIRKARIIFWTAVGVLILLRSGFTLRAVAREAGMVTQSTPAAEPAAPETKP